MNFFGKIWKTSQQQTKFRHVKFNIYHPKSFKKCSITYKILLNFPVFQLGYIGELFLLKFKSSAFPKSFKIFLGYFRFPILWKCFNDKKTRPQAANQSIFRLATLLKSVVEVEKCTFLFVSYLCAPSLLLLNLNKIDFPFKKTENCQVKIAQFAWIIQLASVLKKHTRRTDVFHSLFKTI